MGLNISDKLLSKESSECESNQPDITKLSDFPQGSRRIGSFALSGLFILALFYTLYFARVLLLPITLSLLLTIMVKPIVCGLKNRLYIPEGVGAALVLLTLLGMVSYGVYKLSAPAAEWMAKAPQSLHEIEDKLHALRKPVKQVSEATKQVEKLANVSDGERKQTQVVEVKNHNLRDFLLSQTSGVVIGIATVLILLYFLLASGDLFLRKLVKVLSRLENKKRCFEISRQIQQQISNYFFTVTIIYVGMGLAVGVAMFIMRMPNPVLWGVMAGLLEFIPYLGPALGIGVVAVVSVVTFDNLGYALLAPLVYFGLTAIQANLIFPMVLGRRFALNPVIVFVGLIFWGWMWGIIGILLAVPILATFKIFCDYIEPLSPIGEFLGR
jgi:predicted PurR-regulated permease PerM